MKRLLRSSLFATVQFLMVTAIFAAPSFAKAGCEAQSHDGYVYEEVDGKCSIVGCPSDMILTPRETDSGKVLQSCVLRPERKKPEAIASCEGQYKDLSQAMDNEATKCGEAGLSAEKCIEEVNACDSKSMTAEEESSIDMSTLTSMLSNFGGPSLNIPSAGLKKDVCPTEGSKDYFDEKDRIQRELKEVDRDNAEIEKDIAEEKGKLDKEMKDAQDELTRAQKEVEKKKLDFNKEKAEKTDEMAKNANKIAEDMRNLQKKDLEIRAQIAKAEGDHNRKLMQMTTEMGNAACLAQVKKTHDELKKAGLLDPSNSMANAVQQRKILQKQFDTCTKDFRSQRVSMQEDYLNQVRGYNQDLQNIQEGLASGQQQQQQAKVQLDQALQDLQAAATNEDKALLQQMQNAQQNLVNQQQTMLQKQNALKQKQASLQLRKVQLNKDLDGLGAVPKRGTKTGWRDAASAVRAAATKSVNFNDCCENKDTKGVQMYASYCANKKRKEYAKLLKASLRPSSNRSNDGSDDSTNSKSVRGGTSRPSSTRSTTGGSRSTGGSTGSGGDASDGDK